MGKNEDALQQLLEIRKILEERLKEVNGLIDEWQSFQSRLGQLEPIISQSGGSAKPTADGRSAEEIVPSRNQFRRGGVSPSEIAAKAATMIAENGRPMPRGEIVQALRLQGVPLAGRDINKNVGTIMWRHRSKFVQLPKLGYWLRDVELPGIYTPSNSPRRS